MTCFLKTDDPSEGVLYGRSSCREKRSGSVNEHFFCFTLGIIAENFQAGSRGLNDLILVLISPQSGPRIGKSQASYLF